MVHKGPTGFIVVFGGPVCAPGGGPNCNVKLLLPGVDQFWTTIIICCPAVTFGAGTVDPHGNVLPNCTHPPACEAKLQPIALAPFCIAVQGSCPCGILKIATSI